ncbi:M24 family metallopeptidase [Halomarina ordinaria]|uniref:M24 family metallopeptidase n=1 Tax=Halomarina ordinaria TaxID=3033939 RepID=A0ABD5U5A6_9EURY|nr:Xaa-Pro peptidase family protein [Halomarina sp. PSRA2]
MDPDLSALDDFLDDGGFDGYLVHADGEDSTQRYLSGFDAPDPYVTLYDGERHLLVSSLEYGRARREAPTEDVVRHADFDYGAKREEYGHVEAGHRVIAEFLAERGVDAVAVPGRFPLAVADGLRDLDVSVTAETEGVVTDIRATKTEAELDFVRATQRANERALARAEELVREASVEDGVLVHDGEALTSERVRREMEIALLREGYALEESIVACGAAAADPHDRGNGPLYADEPVIVDVFPRDKESKYFADMTRTFVKGTPSDEVRAWYDLTEEALEAALAAVEPGATGADVHDAVCDVYEAAGEPTLRDDPTTETGFIHSTGHGVGLDIHERPSLGPGGGDLEPGMVITVEPGLYDPDVGGVRIEDIVVVTEDGYENLTDYPRELVVE